MFILTNQFSLRRVWVMEECSTSSGREGELLELLTYSVKSWVGALKRHIVVCQAQNNASC